MCDVVLARFLRAAATAPAPCHVPLSPVVSIAGCAAADLTADAALLSPLQELTSLTAPSVAFAVGPAPADRPVPGPGSAVTMAGVGAGPLMAWSSSPVGTYVGTGLGPVDTVAAAGQGLVMCRRFGAAAMQPLPCDLSCVGPHDVTQWAPVAAAVEACPSAARPSPLLIHALQLAVSTDGVADPPWRFLAGLSLPQSAPALVAEAAEVARTAAADAEPGEEHHPLRRGFGGWADGLAPPMLLALASGLQARRSRGACVDPPVGLLKDDDAVVAEAEEALAALTTRLNATVDAGDVPAVVETLRAAAPMALARALGLRATVGTPTAVLRGRAPVGLGTLLGAFQRRHDPTQALTVGARALAKHCHRDMTGSWWTRGAPGLGGKQAAKNDAATDALHRILSDVRWVNVHMLPHDIVTLELRHSLGFGARWTLAPPTGPGATSVEEGIDFRGFLEPQDPLGHEKGWRH